MGAMGAKGNVMQQVSLQVCPTTDARCCQAECLHLVYTTGSILQISRSFLDDSRDALKGIDDERDPFSCRTGLA